MRVWFPHLHTGGGSAIHARRVAQGLAAIGHGVELAPVSTLLQYCPWSLKLLRRPPDAQVTITDAPIGFALRRQGTRLVTIEHHTVLDPAIASYRTTLQRTVDRWITLGLVKRTLAVSDAVVVHSNHAARALSQVYKYQGAIVIHPGIDTDYFRPSARRPRNSDGRPFRLLWVGNLIKRKGADLVPKILSKLGSGYELRYTSGLRTRWRFETATKVVPLGRLMLHELRTEYQNADLLLFPTRYEGFGYVVAEALACGLPVVTTDCSSLPELIDDGVTGRLCAVDDVEAYASAIEEIAASPAIRTRMAEQARVISVERFDLSRTAREYESLLLRLI